MVLPFDNAAEAAEKDWFDMATKDDLKAAIAEYFTSDAGRGQVASIVHDDLVGVLRSDEFGRASLAHLINDTVIDVARAPEFSNIVHTAAQPGYTPPAQ